MTTETLSKNAVRPARRNARRWLKPIYGKAVSLGWLPCLFEIGSSLQTAILDIRTKTLQGLMTMEKEKITSALREKFKTQHNKLVKDFTKFFIENCKHFCKDELKSGAAQRYAANIVWVYFCIDWDTCFVGDNHYVMPERDTKSGHKEEFWFDKHFDDCFYSGDLKSNAAVYEYKIFLRRIL